MSSNLFEFFKEVVMKNLIVLDVETTQEGGTDGKPDAYFKNNKLLAVGIKEIIHGPFIFIYKEDTVHGVLDYGNEPHYICGNNVKFDYAWIKRLAEEEGNHNPYSIGIDLGVATYLNSGQYKKFPSLDECAEYWGVSERKLPMPSYATKVSDLTDGDLTKYLTQDLEMSKAIIDNILDKCTKKELFLYWIYSNAQVVLAQMEQNGIPIDWQALNKLSDDTSKKLDLYDGVLKSIAIDIINSTAIGASAGFKASKVLDILPKYHTSIKFLHYVMYGQPTIIEMPKTKAKAAGLSNPIALAKVEMVNDTPGEKALSEDTIKQRIEYLKMVGSSSVFASSVSTSNARKDFLEAYLQYKQYRKLQNTYINNLIDNCTETDTLQVRSKYNTVCTNTTRLSSSSPNAQNFPPEIRELFKAPEGYSFISADFKQIEVCGLGYITHDRVLLDDIDNDVDIHKVAGRDTYGENMTEIERRNTKGVVFGTIYGGSAETLSKQTGVPLNDCKAIQESLMTRYSKAFNEQSFRVAYVKSLIKLSADCEYNNGVQVKRTCLSVQPTQHRYSFVERVSDKGEAYVSGPEVKDRPIQGIASFWKMYFYVLLNHYLVNHAPMGLRNAYNEGRIQFHADVHDEVLVSVPDNLAIDLSVFMCTMASDYLPKEMEAIYGHRMPKIVLKTSIMKNWTKE